MGRITPRPPLTAWILQSNRQTNCQSRNRAPTRLLLEPFFIIPLGSFSRLTRSSSASSSPHSSSKICIHPLICVTFSHISTISLPWLLSYTPASKWLMVLGLLRSSSRQAWIPGRTSKVGDFLCLLPQRLTSESFGSFDFYIALIKETPTDCETSRTCSSPGGKKTELLSAAPPNHGFRVLPLQYPFG